jgi:hypothetical protein
VKLTEICRGCGLTGTEDYIGCLGPGDLVITLESRERKKHDDQVIVLSRLGVGWVYNDALESETHG